VFTKLAYLEAFIKEISSKGWAKGCAFELHMDNVLWAFNGKAKKKDVLSIKVCNYVVKFWIDNTCVSPNMRDVVRRRLGPK